MRSKSIFNPSLLAPALELTAAVVLVVAGGAVWHHHHGLAAVAGGMQSLSAEHIANLAELEQTGEALRAVEIEAQQLGRERDRQAEYNGFLMDRIQQEQQALTDSWEAQRPFAESAARLQSEIRRLSDQLRAYRTDVLEADLRIQTRRAEVTSLEQQVAERRVTLAADGRGTDRADASTPERRTALAAATGAR